MEKLIIKEGQKIGLLTLKEKVKGTNNRWGYNCICDCGNKTWVRIDSFKKENYTKSCGCLANITQFNPKDITGKKFNKLTAIDIYKKSKNGYRWNFKCDCGNKTVALLSLVVSGKIKSCGCLAKEQMLDAAAKAYKIRKATALKEGTDLAALKKYSSGEVCKNNKSGITGVVWDKSRQKWVAQIYLKGRCIHLGRYDSKEEAAQARKDGEKKYFVTILEKYKNGDD